MSQGLFPIAGRFTSISHISHWPGILAATKSLQNEPKNALSAQARPAVSQKCTPAAIVFTTSKIGMALSAQKATLRATELRKVLGLVFNQLGVGLGVGSSLNLDVPFRI